MQSNSGGKSRTKTESKKEMSGVTGAYNEIGKTKRLRNRCTNGKGKSWESESEIDKVERTKKCDAVVV